MNGQLLSLGIKKLVLPYVSAKISEKYEPQDRSEVIDNRIKRLESYMESHRQNEDLNSENTSYAHTTPDFPDNQEVATSCIACARSHIAAVSASLKEAIRFCRTEGIMHPEVQTRLATAEEEITALERYDWSPERILASPPEEQEIVNAFLPQIRELRQNISIIQELPDLVKCAATAGRILSEYRMEVLKTSINK